MSFIRTSLVFQCAFILFNLSLVLLFICLNIFFFWGRGGWWWRHKNTCINSHPVHQFFCFHQPFAILLINIFFGSRSFQPALKFLRTWAGCIGGCDETLRQLIEICGTGSRIPGINACLPNYLTWSIYICKIELL